MPESTLQPAPPTPNLPSRGPDTSAKVSSSIKETPKSVNAEPKMPLAESVASSPFDAVMSKFEAKIGDEKPREALEAIAGNVAREEPSESTLKKPDIGEDEVATELGKIRQLRLLLDLPEKSPLLPDNIAELKEQSARDFVEDEIERRLALNNGGPVDQATRTWRETLAKSSPKSRKLDLRERMLARVAQVRGLKDAQSKLAAIKDKFQVISFTDVIDKGTISALNQMDTETLISAIDRLGSIGFRVALRDFKDSTIAAGISSIGKCTDEAYSKIAGTLNRLHFVQRFDSQLTRYSQPTSDGLAIANLAVQGGFSSEQQERIEWAIKFGAIENLRAVFVVEDGLVHKYTPHLHNHEGIQRLLDQGVTGDMAKSLWTLASSSHYFSHLNAPHGRNRSDLSEDAINKLIADGSFGRVTEVIGRSPVDMREYYEIPHGPLRSEISMRISQVESVIENPLLAEWTALVAEITGTDTHISADDPIINNIEEIFAQRRIIEDTLRIYQVLPAAIRPQLKDLFDNYRSGFSVHVNPILTAASGEGSSIENPKTNEDLFLLACANLINTNLPGYKLQIPETVSLLTRHIDKMGDYVSSDTDVTWNFLPAFIEDVVSGKIDASPQAVTATLDYYFASFGRLSTLPIDTSAKILFGQFDLSNKARERFLQSLLEYRIDFNQDVTTTTKEGQYLQEFLERSYGSSRSACLKLLDDFPNWHSYFSDSTPTGIIIDTFFKDSYEVSDFLKIASEKLAANPEMSVEEINSFWRLARDLPTAITRSFILNHFDLLPRLFPGGHPSHEALYMLAEEDPNGYNAYVTMRKLGKDALSKTEQDQWEIWFKQTPKVKELLYSMWDADFNSLYKDGQLTPDFWRLCAQRDPVSFLELANRDNWRDVFGTKLIDGLLEVLPRSTDERRNALTHNQYDRTSAFFQFLNGPHDSVIFELTEQDIRVATDYIGRFGLDKNPYLYYLFKPLFLHEAGELNELPYDIKVMGISTITELESEIKVLRNLLFNSRAITDLAELSPFQRNVLASITGKTTHSFIGRPEMETILLDFDRDVKSGEIAPAPPEYEEFTLQVGKGELQFDPEPYRESFTSVAAEIAVAMDHPAQTTDLTGRLATMYRTRVAEMEQALEKIPEDKRAFIQAKIDAYTQNMAKVAGMQSLDEVLRFVIKIPVDKAEKDEIAAIKRQIVWRRLFEKHTNQSFIEGIRRASSGEISTSAILTFVNLQRELVKYHVLGLDKENEEKYWDDETFKMLTGETRGRQLIEEAFDPVLKPMFEAVSTFELNISSQESVKAIPDKGLVGEMSGYLANACYTAEYPLLKSHPNLVPMKLVRQGEDGNQQFFGSVLLFEVETADKQKALLVRAFNVPDEEQYNISGFIEGFLDQAATIAAKRGATRVLFAGSPGTISNYKMTSAHVVKEYVAGKEATKLAEEFKFNHADITDKCYEARSITPSQVGDEVA